MKGQSKMRNPSVEGYRMLLMLGICILHSCSIGGPKTQWFCYLMMPCVTSFVFISGYYGIRFSWSRIVKILIMVLACVPIAALVGYACGLCGIFGGLLIALRGVLDNWFLWAYVILMTFASVLNMACESPRRLYCTLPIIAVAIGLGFTCGYPRLCKLVPHPAGVGSYTFLMMIGVYLSARLWRCYFAASRIGSFSLLLGIIGLAILATMGFGAYCSPVNVLLAGAMFTLASRMRIAGKFGAAVNFCARSTFPIFILHANGVGFALLRNLNHYMHCERGLPLLLTYLLTGVVFFMGGLVLDMPRRGLAYLVGGKLKFLYDKLDSVFEHGNHKGAWG